MISVTLSNIRILNGGISFPVEFTKVRTVRHLVPLRSRRHSDVNKRRVDGTRWTNWYRMMTSSQTLCNLKIILPFVAIVLFSRKYAKTIKDIILLSSNDGIEIFEAKVTITLF